MRHELGRVNRHCGFDSTLIMIGTTAGARPPIPAGAKKVRFVRVSKQILWVLSGAITTGCVYGGFERSDDENELDTPGSGVSAGTAGLALHAGADGRAGVAGQAGTQNNVLGGIAGTFSNRAGTSVAGAGLEISSDEAAGNAFTAGSAGKASVGNTFPTGAAGKASTNSVAGSAGAAGKASNSGAGRKA